MSRVQRSALVCVCLLVIGVSVSAQDTIFVTEPPYPVAGEPFRIVLSGTVVAFSPSSSADDLFVTLDEAERKVTVTQRGGLIGVPFEAPYLASVEVESLSTGSWHVELRLESEGTPPPLAPTPQKSLGDIFVNEGFQIDGPAVGYSNAPVRWTLSRIDTCVELRDIEIDDQARRIRIPWISGCGILPPDPERIELETDPVGPLAAGPWQIEVVDRFNQPMARHAVEILPNPVRLQNDRFEIQLSWFNNLAADQAFPASAPTRDSALFAFFNLENWEVMVKVLDGCAINDHYWVFSAANTDQGYDILVTDTQTESTWEYHNDLGTASPAVTDIEAFPCL